DATDRLSYALGGRLDRNSAFGTFETVRASVGYVLSAKVRMRASAGSAFKAPSFFENFSTGYVTGNPALLPEHSRSAELGLDAFLDGGALTLKATGYLQKFRDLIDYAGTAPSPGAPNYFNVAAADANGVELEAEYRGFDRRALGASYAWTDTRTTQAGFETTTGASYVVGQKLIRRPPNAFTFSAVRTIGMSGSVQLVALYTGMRDDRDFANYPATPVTLPAYAKLDLSAVVPFPASIARGTALLFRIDNLLDARYDEIARFPAPGRAVFVGVRVGT